MFLMLSLTPFGKNGVAKMHPKTVMSRSIRIFLSDHQLDKL
jgi:hypothetical protein